MLLPAERLLEHAFDVRGHQWARLAPAALVDPLSGCYGHATVDDGEAELVEPFSSGSGHATAIVMTGRMP